jgi:type IV pilus assembly protein PilQ
VTVTFENTPIADVLASFAEFSGKSILLGTGVGGNITSTIKNQPWDVAFQKVLEAQNLSAVEDPPGIITVGNPATLAARDSLEPLRTIILPINYARASALAVSAAGALSKRGKIVADTSTNSLILTDAESRVPQDSLFITQLDVETPQVAIQAKLIFVDRTDIENLGVKYDLGTNRQFFNALVARDDPSTAQPVDTNGDGVPDAFQATDQFTPTDNIIDLGGSALSAIANAGAGVPNPALNLIFSTAIGSFNLTSFVEALQEVNLADLQAEPLISTADNTPASVLVGEKTPIRQVDVAAATGGGFTPPRATTQIVETGIKLEVTPHVTNNKQVLMRLHVENSSIRAAPADVGFTFQTQESDNELLVADGETAVIGGLTVTQVTVSKTGIPFRVDLPIIGRIFGFSNRTEIRRDLLILVTPHVIQNAGAPTTRGQ